MALLVDSAVSENPFPGLRSFEPDEEHLFFGREAQVDELLSKLRETRFLTVVGSSGSGKSSIVRSGLIPAVYGGYMVGAGSGWRVAIARPGDDPIGNLASALADEEVLGGAAAQSDLRRSMIESTLRRGARGLVEAVRQARLPGDENVLVLVDQFEEIFRFKVSEMRSDSVDESSAFVKLLLETAGEQDSPLFVVLTMRSDFLGNCAEFQDLPEAINRGLYLVPRMTREQRRAAICGPVAVAGNEIAPRLVLRLLNDVGDDPDQLPILQHALMRTWDYWQRNHAEGEPLDLRHYETIGTLKEAMSLHAEEAYAELGPARGAAEKLFKCLTEKGSDGRGVRRPASLATICEVGDLELDEAVQVVEAFRRPGRSFLVPPAGVPLEPDRVIDISHESLMRVWSRLRSWVDEESQGAHLYARLAEAAARHQAGEGGLWRDPELQLALTWRDATQPTAAWARRYDPSFERATVFLRLSQEERERETARKETRRRRQLILTRMVAIGSLIAFAVILVAGFFALMAKQEADELRIEAELEREVAYAARQDAEAARTAAEENARRALEAEQEAKESARQAREQFLAAENARELAQLQERVAQQEKAIADEERRRAKAAADAAIQAKEEAVAAAERAAAQQARAEDAEGKTQELRRKDLGRSLAARQVPRLLEEDEPEAAALVALQAYELAGRPVWSPVIQDALRAALAGLGVSTDDELAAVKVLDRGAEIPVAVRAIAVAGEWIFWGREDGVVDALAPGGGTAPSIAPSSAAVRALEVVSGGGALAIGDQAGALRIVPLSGAGATRRLIDGGPIVHALGLSGDGVLAAGLGDGTVRRWRQGPDGDFEELAAWSAAPGRWLLALAWDAKGRLAVGADDGRVRIWEAGSESRQSPSFGSPVTALAFLGDDLELAVGTFEGRIERWHPELPADRQRELVGSHLSSVNSLELAEGAPAGDYLASAGSDGEVRLWPLDDDAGQPAGAEGRGGLVPIVLEGHNAWVWSLAVSQDGRRVYSGDAAGHVKSWATGTEDLVDVLCSPEMTPLARSRWRLDENAWNRYVESLPYDEQKSPCGF